MIESWCKTQESRQTKWCSLSDSTTMWKDFAFRKPYRQQVYQRGEASDGLVQYRLVENCSGATTAVLMLCRKRDSQAMQCTFLRRLGCWGDSFYI